MILIHKMTLGQSKSSIYYNEFMETLTLFVRVCVCVHMCTLSGTQLFATLWTADHQASLSMGFFTQEYWTRLPFASPGYLSNPGIQFA